MDWGETGSAYFVTGATGFLGGRLCEILLSHKKPVIAFGRNKTAGANLNQKGATFIQGDLSDLNLLIQSIPEGAIIIHSGALSSAWGTYPDFYQANVVGTENMLTVATLKKVKRFVHISTPSVYIEAKSKMNISEQDDLPFKKINFYAQTKFLAEQAVDQAFRDGLATITLRPQGIIGPGDTAILPRLIRVSKKGFIPVIGKSSVSIDLTYIDNVVEAIRLAIIAPPVALGKKFNITNDEPIEQLATLKWLLENLGYSVKEKKIPIKLAFLSAKILETAYRAFSLPGEPLLTRYSVCTLAYSRTLDIQSAKKFLNYKPIVPIKQGMEQTVKWFQKYNS